MSRRHRILSVPQHKEPDRVPLFEIWIDALQNELNLPDATRAYIALGQDRVLLQSCDRIHLAKRNLYR